MLKADRFARILDHVARAGSADVHQLAELLGVSGATVRRDLQTLDEQGLLRRPHGGAVTGIILSLLTARENALMRVQEMIVTPDMHERKRLMFEHSEAFVALPGGIGTLEELVEQLTWQQLGRHHKSILLANIANFWEPLLSLLNHMRTPEFIRPTLPINVLMADRVDEILPLLRSAVARTPEAAKELAPEVARRL